jgi:hypothetical protein
VVRRTGERNTARQKLRRSEACVTKILLGLLFAEIDAAEKFLQRTEGLLTAMMLSRAFGLGLVQQDHFTAYRTRGYRRIEHDAPPSFLVGTPPLFDYRRPPCSGIIAA